MADRVGSEIAGYRIVSLLARGGMGEVYLAEHAGLQRRVALKVLAPEFAEEPGFRERFVRESRMAASLDHPNVVPIYEAGEAEGRLFIAMRYVEGTDLRALIRRQGPLEPSRAVAVVAQVADALDAAHRKGLVHRDVKPANILIARDGREGVEHVYLSDFGLTKRAASESGVTGTGQFVGTLDYAAPEQFEGRPVDARTDVYSLGCVLYESLVGRPPFRRETDAEVMYAHLLEEPPRPSAERPDLPAGLDEVVAKAMAKRPGDRYPTGHALGQALTVTVIAEGPRRSSSARRFAIGGGIAAFALIGVVILALALSRNQASEQQSTSSKPPLNSAVEIDPDTGVIENITSGLPNFVCSSPRLEAGEGAMWWLAGTTLTRIDEDTGHKDPPISLPSIPCDVQALTVGFRTVWVGNAGGLLPVDPASGRVLRPVQLPGPQAIPGDPNSGFFFTNDVADGANALWATSDAGRLVRINPTTGDVTIVPVEGATDGVAFGEGAVWVIDRLTSGVTKIDPTTDEAVGSVELSGSVDAIAVGEGAVWVMDAAAGTVTALDPESLESRGNTIRVGIEPSDITVGLAAVWVANEGGGTIYRIDPQTRRVTTIDIGRPIVSLVTNHTKGTVWAVVAKPNPRA